MTDKNKVEELLVRIMNIFSDQFGKQAILRGGMVLRLLDSARLTNDLDYLFIPYKSKKDVVAKVLRALSSLEDAEITHSLNSKCLRCIVTQKGVVAQVEVKVDLDCRVKVISTASLAKVHNKTPRLINVVSFDIALANKLAAWYERRLYRDLYDIYLLCNMGVEPDREVLEKRLKKPVFARSVNEHVVAVDLPVFYEFLKNKIENLDTTVMNQELEGILPEEELLGLDMKLKNIILRKLL